AGLLLTHAPDLLLLLVEVHKRRVEVSARKGCTKHVQLQSDDRVGFVDHVVVPLDRLRADYPRSRPCCRPDAAPRCGDKISSGRSRRRRQTTVHTRTMTADTGT